MQIFHWLNQEHKNEYKIERFNLLTQSKYRIVVFVKSFSRECIELAEKLKQRGTRIVFDINVNYYERWGDYSDVRAYQWVTDEQMENCKAMTILADHVVARSTCLAELCKKYNHNVTWITDPVDTDVYRLGELIGG